MVRQETNNITIILIIAIILVIIFGSMKINTKFTEELYIGNLAMPEITVEILRKLLKP